MRYLCIYCYLFFLITVSTSAGQYDVYWDCKSAQGYWDNPGSWKQSPDSKGWSIPGMVTGNISGVNHGFARVESGCAIIDANHMPTSRVERIYVGGPEGAKLFINGGSLNCNKFFVSYEQGWTGTYVQRAGEVFCESYVCLGEGPNSKTVFKLLGGKFTANNKLYSPYTEADGAVTSIIVDGGYLELFENVYLGKAKGTFAELCLMNGKIRHSGNNFSLAFKGKATFNQTGGVFETDDEDRIRLGWIKGSEALISISGGEFIARKELAINCGKLIVVGSNAKKIEVFGLSCGSEDSSIEFVLGRDGVTPVKVKGVEGAKLGSSNLLIGVTDDFKGRPGDVFEVLYAKNIKENLKLKNLSDKYIFSYSVADCNAGKVSVLELKLERVN